MHLSCARAVVIATVLTVASIGVVVAAPAHATTYPDCALVLGFHQANCDAYNQAYRDGVKVGGSVLAGSEAVSVSSEAVGDLVTVTLTSELTPFHDDFVAGNDKTNTVWGNTGVQLEVNGTVVSASPASNADVVFKSEGGGYPQAPMTVSWVESGILNGLTPCDDDAQCAFSPGEQFSVTFRVNSTQYNPYGYEAFWGALGGGQPVTGNKIGWAAETTESERVIPAGSLAPVAHMTWTPDGKEPNEFVFDGLPSTAFAPATIAKYAWNFGDGSTAETTAPTTTVTHQFTSEGNKTVSLTVTDSNGLTDTDTETITPSLRVEQLQVDPTVVRPHTLVRAALTLQNDGTSTIYGVVPSVVSSKPTVILQGNPNPAQMDIGPAESETFDYPVQAGTDGVSVLALAGSGHTSAGLIVSAATRNFNGVVGNPGLLVDLTGEQPSPNDNFDVKVTLSNPGADPISGITYNDPSGVVAADVSPAVGVATLVTAVDTPPTTLQPHQSVALTYIFHAGDNGSAVFTTAATGTTADDVNGGTKTVTDTTSLSVTVSSVMATPKDLDAAAQVAWDQAGQIMAASYQNTQNILAGGITVTGAAQPTEADYEGIRNEGLSPGIAALAENPTGLNAFGQGYADEARTLTNQAAAGTGQALLTAYTEAKDPQAWESMAAAAYLQMQALPAATVKNAGYLGLAIANSQDPDGIMAGLADSASAATAAATSLQNTANTVANKLTDEILADRALAKSNPNAYYRKLGGYSADAEVATAGAAVNLAVGDVAVKTGVKALSVLAGRVGLTAIEGSASAIATTTEAAAATGDGEAGGVALAQGNASGTGSSATGLNALDGAVSKFQQLEVAGVVTTENAATIGGVIPSDQQKLNNIIANVKQKYGVQLEIGVRTSEPLSLGLDVSPKPEIIKPKAVSNLDLLMGAPTDAAGTSTIFNPTELSAQQIADYEVLEPGFAQAYEARYAAQKELFDTYKSSNLATLVDASSARLADGSLQFPDGITAVVGRPQPLGTFTIPTNLVYLEQLDSPVYLAQNNISAEYAAGLKQQMIASYPDLMKVQINTVSNGNGSLTFIDGLKNRPYGSDLDIQYVRPADGADWPSGQRGQIETDVNSQFKTLTRFPNHGYSDAAADLQTAYYSAAAKFQMSTVNPALASLQASAIYDRYQLAAKLLDQQSGRLAFEAAVSTDPTQRSLLLAQSLALHKSGLKMGATTLDQILAYGSGEKILIFTGGDIRVGYTPLLTKVQRLGQAQATGFSLAARTAGLATIATTPLSLATTMTVTSLSDGIAANDGQCEAGDPCTLREAVTEADNSQVPVSIDLPAGTITLTQGPLSVTGAFVTLVGGGAGTTISGGGTTNLIVTSGGALTISNMTLTDALSGGESAIAGAAVSADRTALTLTNSSVTDDDSDEPGGGLFVSDGGSLTLSRATFSGDHASLGGALAIADSALTVTDSTFTDNGAADDGGAIHASYLPLLTVTGSSFTTNTAGQRGGAIYDEGGDGVQQLTNNAFSGNAAGAEGGAVAAVGLVSTSLSQQTLVISAGAFTANTGRTGGAIASDDAPLTVDGTLLTLNTADLADGGAIAASGPLTVTGARFSANTSAGNGGAITAGNDTVISHATFSDNTASGLGGALALLGPGADGLEHSTLTGDAALAGGSEVWRDGGSLTTDSQLGTGLLDTLDGYPVALVTSITTPSTTTGAAPSTGEPSMLPFTGLPVTHALWIAADSVALGLVIVGLSGAIRRPRRRTPRA